MRCLYSLPKQALHRIADASHWQRRWQAQSSHLCNSHLSVRGCRQPGALSSRQAASAAVAPTPDAPPGRLDDAPEARRKLQAVATALSIPYEHVRSVLQHQPGLLATSTEALRAKIERLAATLGLTHYQALYMVVREPTLLEIAPQVRTTCALVFLLCAVAAAWHDTESGRTLLSMAVLLVATYYTVINSQVNSAAAVCKAQPLLPAHVPSRGGAVLLCNHNVARPKQHKCIYSAAQIRYPQKCIRACVAPWPQDIAQRIAAQAGAIDLAVAELAPLAARQPALLRVSPDRLLEECAVVGRPLGLPLAGAITYI